MSRAGGHVVVSQRPQQATAMDFAHVSETLQQGLQELDLPTSRSPPQRLPKPKTDSSTLLSKILKEKAQSQANKRKEEQAREQHKARGDESDEEEERLKAEECAQRAKHNEQVAEDMLRRRQAAAGPPIFAQVLFPIHEQAMRCCLETETELAKDCRELLEDWPNEVDEVTLTKEILLGGWLQAHYLRTGTMPASCQQSLFKLAYLSADKEVSHQAFLTLQAVLRKQSPSQTSGLYSQSRVQKNSECRLTDGDFKEAMTSLGVKDLTSAAKLREANQKKEKAKRKGDDSEDEDRDQTTEHEMRGWSDARRPPAIQKIQQVISLLKLAATLQAEGSCNSLPGQGCLQLLITVLSLKMDPACCLLASELEEAAVALIKAVDESTWSLKFSTAVSQIMTVSGSYRGVVEILRFLSQQKEERAQALCTHTAAQLLPTLLLQKGAEPPKAKKSRGSEEVNPEAVVKNLKWFNNGKGFALLGKHLRDGQADTWELRSVIHLMDLLLWPHIYESRESDEPSKYESFIETWHAFCAKLPPMMRQDEDGAAIKLLTTTISTRNNRSQGLS